MSPRKSLSNVIDNLLISYALTSEKELEDVDNSIIDEYKKLNEKCDNIISKIKSRKEK